MTAGLLSLPPELLWWIAEYLPKPARYVLRTSCRDFFRLLQHQTTWDTEEQKNEAKNLLQRDLFCESCLQPRAKKWRLHKPLWCSGCKDHHVRLLFSAKQRKKRRQERVCIGREGGVWLCDHIYLQWSDLEQQHSEVNPYFSNVGCNCHTLTATVDNISGGRTYSLSLSGSITMASEPDLNMAHLDGLLCPHVILEGDWRTLPMQMVSEQLQRHHQCWLCGRTTHWQDTGGRLKASVDWTINGLKKPTDLKWLKALDLSDIFSVDETRGITWCEESSCMLYQPRHRAAALIREVRRGL